MFIDVHLPTQLPALCRAFQPKLAHCSSPGTLANRYRLVSGYRNVPSTILPLNYVPASTLAWAVNIGGFGLLPGSLANLIVLRMANDRRIWWRFHFYSLPMLAWAALVGYGLLQMSAVREVLPIVSNGLRRQSSSAFRRTGVSRNDPEPPAVRRFDRQLVGDGP